MKFNKTKILTLIALSSVANYASADNYQYEASIGISDGDIELGNAGADTESIDLSFVANFSEVDTSKGPLAEASFLDRASSFSVDYSDGEIESGGASADVTDLTAALRFVSESGVTIEANISDGEIGNVDNESFGFAIGYYIAENTEFGIAYEDVEVGGFDTDAIFLGIKHVSTGDVAFSIEAALGSVDTGRDEDTAVSIEGIFYPTSQFGVGANFTSIDSSVDNDIIEIFADWFITPSAALTLSYTETELGNAEADSVSITGRFRF